MARNLPFYAPAMTNNRQVFHILAKLTPTGLVVCILLYTQLVTGCAPRVRGAGGDPSRSPSEEIAYLRERLETRDVEVAKLTEQYKRQVELNAMLREDNVYLKEELQRVEEQFVTFERRLSGKETKVTAVAAIAETQLMLDKMRSEGSPPLDTATVNDVQSWLATSDEMSRRQKYAAAVYYAGRAMRALNRADRRHTLSTADEDTHIITATLANLRKGPGSDFDVIAQLSYGTVIVRTKVDNDWSEVRTKAGKTGWIHNSLIR